MDSHALGRRRSLRSCLPSAMPTLWRAVRPRCHAHLNLGLLGLRCWLLQVGTRCCCAAALAPAEMCAHVPCTVAYQPAPPVLCVLPPAQAWVRVSVTVLNNPPICAKLRHNATYFEELLFIQKRRTLDRLLAKSQSLSASETRTIIRETYKESRNNKTVFKRRLIHPSRPALCARAPAYAYAYSI